MDDLKDMAAVAEIAGRLSEEKRAFLLLLPVDGGWKETASDVSRLGSNALRGFGQSGLIEGYYREVMRHRLTPLGLRVRAFLQQSGDSR